MFSLNLKYFRIIIILMGLNACSHIVGRKTKKVTFYLQQDSVTLLTNDGPKTGTEPFELTVETQRPSIEFRVMKNGDTSTISYKHQMRDFCMVEPFLTSLITDNTNYEKKIYTYPKRIFMNLSKDSKKSMSAFPTLS